MYKTNQDVPSPRLSVLIIYKLSGALEYICHVVSDTALLGAINFTLLQVVWKSAWSGTTDRFS